MARNIRARDLPRLFQHTAQDCMQSDTTSIQSTNRWTAIKMNKAHEAVALFDLDGTLADFDGSMRHTMEAIATPGEKAYYEEQSDEPPFITARRRLVKTQPGFWENLPKFQLGFDILEKTILLKYSHTIVSKGPRKNPTAWAEKIRWCEKNLPMESIDFKISLVEDKGHHYGKVLVDDFIPYVERWLEWRPRGLVIMPAHDRNASFKHPNVVRYDGTNINEVVERLTMQRATAAD